MLSHPLRAMTIGIATALTTLPAAAQIGIQPPRQPNPASAPAGAENPATILGNLPMAQNVRIGWVMLRIQPSVREGRHIHGLNALYYTNPQDCETARTVLYESSPSSLCLPVAFPPY